MSTVEELKAVLAGLDHPPVTIDDGQSVVKSHVESYCNAAAFLRDHGQALVEAVADAERYRWLRGRPRDYDGRSNGFHIHLAVAKPPPNDWSLLSAYGHVLDEAIDLARTKASAGGGV